MHQLILSVILHIQVTKVMIFDSRALILLFGAGFAKHACPVTQDGLLDTLGSSTLTGRLEELQIYINVASLNQDDVTTEPERCASPRVVRQTTWYCSAFSMQAKNQAI